MGKRNHPHTKQNQNQRQKQKEQGAVLLNIINNRTRRDEIAGIELMIAL